MPPPRIAYRKGYKYQLAETASVQTDIFPDEDIETQFITLKRDGMLKVYGAYAWDGPSGPTFDTPSAMGGSLFHDALYQLMRMGLLDRKWRHAVDKLYRRICLEDGMWPPRAWWHFEGVDHFAAGAAQAKSRKLIITAP